MTLQNRVNPFGEIVATPARGTFMGNRGGCFHDDHQQLTQARWASRQWIICQLEHKGQHIEKLMSSGHYTELFFLDEATALAIVDTWLATPYEGGRHDRRLAQIDDGPTS